MLQEQQLDLELQDRGMSKRFRYDDSARLEREALLSDDRELERDGERSDTKLTSGGSVRAINGRFKAALPDSRPPVSRESDTDTTDFGGGTLDKAVGDESLNVDAGISSLEVSSTGNPRDTEVLITPGADHEDLIVNTHTAVNSQAKAQLPGPEIDEDGIVTEYEVALKHLGFGPFHVFLMIVNGIAYCADAVEILSLAFVLPLLNKPDEFGMSNTEGAILSSVIFIGMLFGSYIWGSVADITGRRITMLLSLTCSGVFGLASAFVPSYWLFTLMRFFSGFG